MIDPTFPSLSKAIAGSLLWRGGTALVDAIAAAWRTSSTARIVASARVLARLSTLAWIVVVAGCAAFAAQWLVPAYVRPGLPWIWPLTAIVVAATVALGARAFERAWPQSIFARLVMPRPHAR